jgi:hypothetical protein
MMNILPDRRKSRFDEGLAERMNKLAEEEARKEKLEEKVRKEEPKGVVPEQKVPATIKDICQGYEEFMRRFEEIDNIPTEITDRYNPTKKQVLEFSRRVEQYLLLPFFAGNTAIYLSALMQSSKDKEFEIDLPKRIMLNSIGYRLQGKKLAVNGNAGNWVGSNAKDSVITVNGDVCGYLGLFAQNCIIRVHGEAGDEVGYGAENSKIYITGSHNRLSEMIGKNTCVYEQRKRLLLNKRKWVRLR